MGIDRLKKAGIHEIETLAVISEETMKPLCDKHGVHFVEHENQPLGRKKNYGLRCSLNMEWDYLVEIGSDDLLKTEYLTLFPWDRDVMCLQDAAWLDSSTGRARRIKDKTGKFGAGRAYSRNIIEQMNPMWHDLKFNGLDGDSMFRMAVNGIKMQSYHSEKPLVIDIKSDYNIWTYRNNLGHPYTFEEAIEGLSDNEKDAICSLLNKKSAALTEG